MGERLDLRVGGSKDSGGENEFVLGAKGVGDAYSFVLGGRRGRAAFQSVRRCWVHGLRHDLPPD